MRSSKPLHFVVILLLAGSSASAQDDAFKKSILPFVTANCYVCHGPQRQLGDFNLSKFNTSASMVNNRDEWKMVLEQLEIEAMPPLTLPPESMPPGGIPKPSHDDRQAAIKSIKAEFKRADLAIVPQAGRVSARRLNRVEYNNTVQDLLGVKLWPADEFPQDDAAYGFDNIADALTISPVLMEKYMSAAEKVARAAVFGPARTPPAVRKLEQLERDVTNTTEVPKEYDQTGLTTDRALHARHRFPVDGVYLFRVTARGFRPLGCEPLELGLWLDGKLVTELLVDPKEDGPSLLGGRQDLFGKPQDHKLFVPAGDHWVAATVLRMYEGLPPVYRGPRPSTRKVSTQPVEVALQQAEREKLQQDTPATRPGAASAPASQSTRRRRGNRLAPIDTQVGIDYVDVIGPLEHTPKPSAESQKLLFPRPDMDRTDPATPREILTHVVRRAFRRPVTDNEVDRYVKLFDLVRKQGDSFEEALAVALQGVLTSPDFLLRVEKQSPNETVGQTYLLTDHELATRLSYFLWSTMPDAPLRAAADDGSLRKPDVLEAHVRRMLKDPRSAALASNFGGQWLRFRALESVTPDFKLFPDFDAYLRMSMEQETHTFFDYIVQNDRSILDFVDGNYTFVNEKLAALYGIPGVKGTEFRKVDLTGTPRAGVITQASVLTVSSYANRTSPVLRGKWILENLLNAPPPPPPNNVPSLEITMKNNPHATVRKQLEIHRENPSCFGCHAKMDPLGMGLENFNAIGAWRSQDGSTTIDSSGKLPDGRSFNGPAELRTILKADRDAFVECLSEKLFTYAIGRGVEMYDTPTLRQIADNVARNDYRFSSLVLEIVRSLPFQKRTAGSPS